MTHDPIAYTYEADTHCPECALNRFGRGDGYPDTTFWIPEDAIDIEGNPIGVIAPWDEWQSELDSPQTLACGTCLRVIEEYIPAI